MSDAMPTGWMSADEARKWARRGVWAYKIADTVAEGGTFDGMGQRADADEVLADILDGETWRYIGPHPDDDPAGVSGLVELEAWCAVHTSDDGTHYANTFTSKGDAERWSDEVRGMYGTPAKIVRLVGYTAPPVPEAVETVEGVTHD